MNSIYSSGEYLDRNATWHVEDSPWKASQIARMIQKHSMRPATIAEIGCGAGAILHELSRNAALGQARFRGYDISPQAIALCQQRADDRLEFICQDLLTLDSSHHFDLLLVIDVLEHVPNYMGFLEQCRVKATHKIYHIPLDIHVSSVIRGTFLRARQSMGHLHYFSAESALATLRDTGHEIVDHAFTGGALGLFRTHPSVRRALANVPRWLISKLSVPLAARLLGGYSLLVLAK
jgi:SAM-dependent methyltransferase